jgi:hypothetical protein
MSGRRANGTTQIEKDGAKFSYNGWTIARRRSAKCRVDFQSLTERFVKR